MSMLRRNNLKLFLHFVFKDRSSLLPRSNGRSNGLLNQQSLTAAMAVILVKETKSFKESNSSMCVH